MPNGQDQIIQTPDAAAQAKAALPKPEYMAPAEGVVEETPLGKAYKAATDWLGEHEKNLDEKYLTPFRAGLDSMAADLQQAGESGHTKSGGQLTEPARALAEGTGAALKMVPVGKNVKDTALMAATDLPKLPEGHIFEGIEGVRPVPPKDIIEGEGLVYKGELTKDSGVHLFEHPDYPGQTAALDAKKLTPETIRSKMNSKVADFKLGKNNADVYRAHTEGKPEIDLGAHAHATTDPEQAKEYTAFREGGQKQKVSKVSLEKFDPKDYEVMEGPRGAKWVKFKRQLTKDDLQ